MDIFPDVRLRRLRRSAPLRRLFDDPMPGPEKMMWPTFIVSGSKVKDPIDAMPGQYRLSTDMLIKELAPLVKTGIGSVLLFGVADGDKDSEGSGAYDDEGTVQNAVRAVKQAYPELVVCTDVCLCAYTEHGHCGPLAHDGSVDNDAAIELLARTAVSHANAGADIVAPSAMMDGQVSAIREGLDHAGHKNTILMSYSSKFASSMYGPFREAEHSEPGKGDRKGYQASYSDSRQAIRESIHDENEGADILMVKPALFYLDIITRVRSISDLPIAAYNVSGEYSMLIATAERGWGDLREMVRESMMALSRAGTDIIISYWANRYTEFFGDRT